METWALNLGTSVRTTDGSKWIKSEFLGKTCFKDSLALIEKEPSLSKEILESCFQRCLWSESCSSPVAKNTWMLVLRSPLDTLLSEDNSKTLAAERTKFSYLTIKLNKWDFSHFWHLCLLSRSHLITSLRNTFRWSKKSRNKTSKILTCCIITPLEWSPCTHKMYMIVFCRLDKVSGELATRLGQVFQEWLKITLPKLLLRAIILLWLSKAEISYSSKLEKLNKEKNGPSSMGFSDISATWTY